MAASQKQRIVLQIDADTKAASSAIEKLQSQLKSIQLHNFDTGGLKFDIADAAAAAKVLQKSLAEAYNQDTGKLNFTAFSQSLTAANTNLQSLVTSLSNVGLSGKQALQSLTTALASAEIPAKKLQGAFAAMGQSLLNTAKWTISSNLIHGIESAISGAVGYAQDLNKTLVSIQQVSGQSFEQMQKFTVQANQAAQRLSTTTKAYADASLLYYQQGDSAEMAAKKAEITLKATNSAFTATAQEMSQMLTATWNAYQAGSDQLEHYVDVMAALGASTATSLEEISTALQKVAATANTVGVSMEKMSSMIATVSSATRQAPTTVGTAMNTILNRMSSLKLGETLEDGVNLTKYTQALATVGVNVLDASGDLREMGSVIEEVGSKWQMLSSAQKAALAQTIGGVRQYTNIMALFENWDKYQKNLQTAMNSNGQLQRMQDVYAEGWEGAAKRTRAAMEELYETLIDDKFMINMQNMLTTLTKGLNGLVTGLGGLPGILAIVANSMQTAFGDKIGTGVAKIATGFHNIGLVWQDNKQAAANNPRAVLAKTTLQFLTGSIPNTTERTYKQNLQTLSTQVEKNYNSALNRGDTNLAELYKRQQSLINQTLQQPENNLQTKKVGPFNLPVNSSRVINMAETKEQLADVGEAIGVGLTRREQLNGAQDNSLISRLLNSNLSHNVAGWSLDTLDINTTHPKDGMQKIVSAVGLDKFSQQLLADSDETLMPFIATNMRAMMAKNVLGDLQEQLDFGPENNEHYSLQQQAAVIKAISTISAQALLEADYDRLNDLTTNGELDEAKVERARQYALDQSTWAGLTSGALNDAEQINDTVSGKDKNKILNMIANSVKQYGAEVLNNNKPTKQEDLTSWQQMAKNIKTHASQIYGAVASIGAGVTAAQGAFDAFNSDNFVAHLSAVANMATGFAQSFLQGGPWGAALYALTSGITFAINSINAYNEEIRQQNEKTYNEAIDEAKQTQAKIEKITTNKKDYEILNDNYSQGLITQTAYEQGLLAVAEAMGIQSAAVLALKGDYEGLNAEIQKTLMQQLEVAKNEAQKQYQASETTVKAGWEAIGSNYYSENGNFKFYNMGQWNPGAYKDAEGKSYSLNGVVPKQMQEEIANILGFNINSPKGTANNFLATLLGGMTEEWANGTTALNLGSSVENLIGAKNRLDRLGALRNDETVSKSTRSYIEALFNDTDFAQFYQNLSNIVGDADILLTNLWKTTAQQQISTQLTKDNISEYSSEQRASYVSSILGTLSINETDSVYELAKTTIEEIIDSYVNGIADGNIEALSVATKSKNYEQASKEAKKWGLTLADQNADIWEYTNSAFLGSSNIVEANPNYILGLQRAQAIRQARQLVTTNRTNYLNSDFNHTTNLESFYDILGSIYTRDSKDFQQIFGQYTKADLAGLDPVIAHSILERAMAAAEKLATVSTDDQNIIEQGASLIPAIQKAVVAMYQKTINGNTEAINAFAGYNFGDTVDWEGYLQFAQDNQWESERIQKIIDARDAYNKIEADFNFSDLKDLTVSDIEKRVETLSKLSTTIEDLSSDSLQNFLDQLQLVGVSLDEWLNADEIERKTMVLKQMREELANMAKAGASSETLKVYSQQIDAYVQDISNAFQDQQSQRMDAIKSEWEEQRNAATSVIDTLRDHLGSIGELSFGGIEQLRQDLVAAGVEAERVEGIIKELQNASEGNKTSEEIWSEIAIGTEAALAKLATYYKELSPYEGQSGQIDFQTNIDEIKQEVNPLTGTIEITEVDDTVAQQKIAVGSYDATLSFDEKGQKLIANIIDENGEIKQMSINADETTTQLVAALQSENGQLRDVTVTVNDNGIISSIVDKEHDITINLLSPTLEEKNTITDFPDADVLVKFTVDQTTLDAALAAIDKIPSEKIVSIVFKTENNGKKSMTYAANVTNPFAFDDIGWSVAHNKDRSDESIPSTSIFYGAPTIANQGHRSRAKQTVVLAGQDNLSQIRKNNLREQNEKFIIDENGTLQAIDTKTFKAFRYARDGKAYGKTKQAIGYFNKPVTEEKYGDIRLSGMKAKYDAGELDQQGLLKVYYGLLGAANQNNHIDTMASKILAQINESFVDESGTALTNVGEYLLAGLQSGLETAGADINWDIALNKANISGKIYEAFAKALMIQSPSKLTRALAPYLFEGLGQGMQDASKTIDYSNSLGWLPDKIRDGFIKSIQQSDNRLLQNALTVGLDSDTYSSETKLIGDQLDQMSRDYFRGLGEIGDPMERLTRSRITSSVLHNMGINDLNAVTDWDTFLQQWAKIYNDQANDIVKEIKKTVTDIQDLWKTGLSQLFVDENQKRQEYYDRLNKDFMAVTQGQKGLINGKSLIETFGNDAEGLGRVLRASNVSPENLYDFITNPHLNYSAITMPQLDRNSVFTGANAFANGNLGITWDTYQQNVEQWVKDQFTSNASDQLKNSVIKALTPDVIASLNAAGLNMTPYLVHGQIDKNNFDFAEFGRQLLQLENYSDYAKILGAYTNPEEFIEGIYTAIAQQQIIDYQNQNTLLEPFANQIGIATNSLGDYCESLALVNGQTLDWNEALKEGQELVLAEAAAQGKETTDAIQTIKSLVKGTAGVDDFLMNTNKTTLFNTKSNYSDQALKITQLTQALETIFQTDLSPSWLASDDEKAKRFVDLLDQLGVSTEKTAKALEEMGNILAERRLKELDAANGDENYLSERYENLFAQDLTQGHKYGEYITPNGDTPAANTLAKMQEDIANGKLTTTTAKELLKMQGIVADIRDVSVPIVKNSKQLDTEIQSIQNNSTDIYSKAGKMVGVLTSLQKNSAQFGENFEDARDTVNDILKQWYDEGGEQQQAFQQAMSAAASQGLLSQAQIEGDAADIAGLNIEEFKNLSIEGQINWLNGHIDDPPEIDPATGKITYTVDSQGTKVSYDMVDIPAGTVQTSLSGGGDIGLFGMNVGSWTMDGDINGQTSMTIPLLAGGSVEGKDNGKGGGGGGGGGGAKKTRKAKKTERIENDRYHEINKLVERQQHQMNMLDKAKDRAYGAKHLQALGKEIDALKTMNNLEKAHLDEVNANISAQEKLLKNSGATIEDGVIKNQADLVRKAIDDYNKSVKWWNGLTAKQQEKESNKMKFEKAEKEYQDFMDLMKEYEDNIALRYELEEGTEDRLNQISSLLKEQILEKLTLRIDFDARDLTQIDRIIGRWTDKLDKQDQVLAKTFAKMDIYAQWDENGNITGGQLGAILAARQELDAQYANGFLNEADYMEALNEFQDKWADVLDSVEEVRDAIGEIQVHTLELANTELQKLTDQLSHNRDMLQGYIELQNLLGKGNFAKDTTKFYEATVTTDVSLLRQATTHLNDLYGIRDDLVADLESMNEAAKEITQRTLDEVNQQIMDAESEQLDLWKQTLEDAQALLENKTQVWLDTLDASLNELMNMTRGLAELEDDYAWYEEERDMYLSTSKELYEVSKLNRQIENSIADLTTKTSKARLKALKEEINAQSEKNRLTEYDVQMMQLQYKHALALQELEEAKNAKNIVRLTRDENGNYGYQYTTDPDKLNDAQQKVEDALQEINELAAKRTAELEKMEIEAMRKYADQLKEVAADTTLTEEQKYNKMLEISQQAQTRLLYYQQQYWNASNALLENQTYVQERYRTTILENTGMLQDQLFGALTPVFDANDEFATRIIEAIAGGDAGAIAQALKEYYEHIDESTQVTGMQWDDLLVNADYMVEAIDGIEESLTDLNDTLFDMMMSLDEMIIQWAKLSGNFMDTMTDVAEDTATNMHETEAGFLGDYVSVGIGGKTPESMGVEGLQYSEAGHYGYAWTYKDQGRHTSSGFASLADARKAALQDIDEYYTDLITKASEDKSENGGPKVVRKLQREKRAAWNKFKKALEKGGTEENFIYSYDTGGLNTFTGPAWLDGTKQSPELVLNAEDTKNMLDTVNAVRELINANALGMLYAFSGFGAAGIDSQPSELQQNVTITAEFPNATDRHEIEAAFGDIINLASQYANQRV